MKLQILLLMLPLAYARLSIRLDVSTNMNDVKVELMGEDDHVIDEDETILFRLTEGSLKEACRRFHGARPTNVYLHSPTPWEDLYQTYGWFQVHRVLKPVKVAVLGIHSEPEIIATQQFTNHGTKSAHNNGQISQSLINTVTNSWNSGDIINVGQEVNYELTIPVGKVGGKTTFSYLHQWGKSGSHAEAVTVTATAGVSVPVAPGETVVSTLTASRATVEVEVTYEASVYGDVATHFEYPHKGRHFWEYGVNAVLEAGDLPRTIRRSEIIKIGFYTEMDIMLNEKDGIHSQPEIIATHKFTNNGTKTANYDGQISQSVTNTVTNSWNSGHSINVDQEVNYEFLLPLAKTTFSYSHQWGRSGSQDEAVTVTATAGVSVPVAPGDSVMSTLTASRGTMELKVTYEASLYGKVAVNYYYTHKGHHFWGLDVKKVMQAGNLPLTIRSEIIKVGFYTDVDITLNEKSGRNRSLRSIVEVK